MYVSLGTQVKSSYDADERPTAAFEFTGFVSVESKFRYFQQNIIPVSKSRQTAWSIYLYKTMQELSNEG